MYWANKGKKLADLQSELDRLWEAHGYLDGGEKLRAHVRAVIVDLERTTDRKRLRGKSRELVGRILARLKGIA